MKSLLDVDIRESKAIGFKACSYDISAMHVGSIVG